MAEILPFHHAQGQTARFLAFADELRAAGHVEGHLFADSSLPDYDESPATLLEHASSRF